MLAQIFERDGSSFGGGNGFRRRDGGGADAGVGEDGIDKLRHTIEALRDLTEDLTPAFIEPLAMPGVEYVDEPAGAGDGSAEVMRGDAGELF